MRIILQFYRATLCWRSISGRLCPSVCLSVGVNQDLLVIVGYSWICLIVLLNSMP